MHRPYRVPYSVEVKEKGKEPWWEDRVAHISARNAYNAQKRLTKRTQGVERLMGWPVRVS